MYVWDGGSVVAVKNIQQWSAWSAWLMFNGNDSTTSLQAARRLNCQIQEVQQMSMPLSDQGTIGCECFLSGDGKVMQSSHAEGKLCWLCDCRVQELQQLGPQERL